MSFIHTIWRCLSLELCVYLYLATSADIFDVTRQQNLDTQRLRYYLPLPQTLIHTSRADYHLFTNHVLVLFAISAYGKRYGPGNLCDIFVTPQSLVVQLDRIIGRTLSTVNVAVMVCSEEWKVRVREGGGGEDSHNRQVKSVSCP